MMLRTNIIKLLTWKSNVTIFSRRKRAPRSIWVQSPVCLTREQQFMGQVKKCRVRSRQRCGDVKTKRRCRWSGAATSRQLRHGAVTAPERILSGQTSKLQLGKCAQAQKIQALTEKKYIYNKKKCGKNQIHCQPAAFITIRMLTWTTNHCHYFTWCSVRTEQHHIVRGSKWRTIILDPASDRANKANTYFLSTEGETESWKAHVVKD